MPAGVLDVVVVGGGHNGLVCAAYLAQAGQRVCVVERRALSAASSRAARGTTRATRPPTS